MHQYIQYSPLTDKSWTVSQVLKNFLCLFFQTNKTPIALAKLTQNMSRLNEQQEKPLSSGKQQ